MVEVVAVAAVVVVVVFVIAIEFRLEFLIQNGESGI